MGFFTTPGRKKTAVSSAEAVCSEFPSGKRKSYLNSMRSRAVTRLSHGERPFVLLPIPFNNNTCLTSSTAPSGNAERICIKSLTSF